MTDLTIVILSWNTKHLLRKCCEAIWKYSNNLDFQVIVVDNGSTDGSQEMLQQDFPSVKLIQNNENLGFAKANNLAIKASSSPLILLLNSDALVTEGALCSVIAITEEHPRAGIVGALLINPDGSFQASHSKFPGLWQEFLILSGVGRLLRGKWFPSLGPEIETGPQVVDYVEGACLLIRRTAFEEVGGLSEDYFMYAEEVDWCLRMKRNNWEVWYQPNANVIHYGGASSLNRKTARERDLYYSRVLYFKKHQGVIKTFILKWMIVGMTSIKYCFHEFLYLISKGHKGRPVISPLALINFFREI